ncbi:ABC transporter permease [Leucobacter insecticola]|uniref:ABC transporter permease n=1 Tax=Leucobacter insecticola TaxID=2714934 RepID=A0A6G8FGK4_9MICO|nr:ABC transporter permease [Leucobacter insecticola]QIM15646.1 ABC transporter permease [Leucobacter insecticola]
MNTLDIIRSAAANTFRSKARAILTILAIFTGAFTLTLTSGLGTGVNNYITDTVSGAGAADAMTVSKSGDDPGVGLPGAGSSGPREYDPNAISAGGAAGAGTPSAPGAPSAGTVSALDSADIDALAEIGGVRKVEANRTISLDYIQVDTEATKYVASVGSLIPGQTVVMAAGVEPGAVRTDDADAPGTASTLQLALPVDYVDALGFANDDAALGQPVVLAITDAERTQHVLEATVVGVAEDPLVSPTGPSLLVNDALSDALFTAQQTGLTPEQADRYASATVWFDPAATPAEIDALKSRLGDAGYTGTTLKDQLGTVTAVTDGIVLVLNAFAIIALLAAAFGIVNTLYMSVQERTREIGLMKAMGMGSGRVFSLFSLEAAFLGFLGSALGALVAMVVGIGVSASLATTLLADLSGLTLIAFDPASIITVIVLVMGIAFLAGTLPAVRAAKADPVESLRYE